jgi:hypothetical protein
MAALAARAEMTEQQQEFMAGVLETQLERAEETLELAAQAAMAEQQEQQLSEIREENASLKARVAELEKGRSAAQVAGKPRSLARPRTARRATPEKPVVK